MVSLSGLQHPNSLNQQLPRTFPRGLITTCWVNVQINASHCACLRLLFISLINGNSSALSRWLWDTSFHIVLFSSVRMLISSPGEMAQPVKCCPRGMRTSVWMPRTHIKSWTKPHVQCPHTEELGQENPWGHYQPLSLANCQDPGPGTDPASKTNEENNWGRQPTSTSSPHACACNTHTYLCMHVLTLKRNITASFTYSFIKTCMCSVCILMYVSSLCVLSVYIHVMFPLHVCSVCLFMYVSSLCMLSGHSRSLNSTSYFTFLGCCSFLFFILSGDRSYCIAQAGQELLILLSRLP